MAELVVKTRLKSSEVKKRFALLPKMISGQAPDPYNVRPYFFALVARYLYERIHEAFVTKAAGGTDSLGNSWRALKPKTIKRRLSPRFVQMYPQSALLLINRVTDRLLNSLAPGQISGVGYVPVREQLYLLKINELILGSDVPYSGKVHSLRRLWPRNMKRWITEACDMALDKCLLLVARKLEYE
jgi:hypothetical protein